MVLRLDPGVNIQSLQPAVYSRLVAMATEYFRIAGRPLRVTSGYRTRVQQRVLRARDPSHAAIPGRSMHEYGEGVDIDSQQADFLDSRGLLAKFGFHRPLLHAKNPERWHIERIGLQYERVRRLAALGGLLLLVGVVIVLSR